MTSHSGPGSLSQNTLCGIYLEHGFYGAQKGTYTAEGITKLSEGLKGSGVTSLKCACHPQSVCFCVSAP